MTNDEKDRHVVAAAVHAAAETIVTLNLRHFMPEHLQPWGVAALHPQSFLIEIFRQEQPLVMENLSNRRPSVAARMAKLVSNRLHVRDYKPRELQLTIERHAADGNIYSALRKAIKSFFS
jgi:hypothetical protein